MRDVLALIGSQGMVNEIILGVLDPLLLNTTAKVETFHPLCSCSAILRDFSAAHITGKIVGENPDETVGGEAYRTK